MIHDTYFDNIIQLYVYNVIKYAIAIKQLNDNN